MITIQSSAKQCCNVLRFMLIRHGEATTNLNEGCFGGRINPSPLTLRGQRQASLTGRYLAQTGFKFDDVYSSCAVRAIRTAEIVAGHTGFDPKKIHHTEEVAEIDRGRWTALPRKPLVTPTVAADMGEHPLSWKTPGGESLLDVRHRMVDYICGTLASKYVTTAVGSCTCDRANGAARKAPYTIGIFSHATAIKCFLQGISSLSSVHNNNFQIDHCSMTEVLYDTKSGLWKISKINFLPLRPKF